MAPQMSTKTLLLVAALIVIVMIFAMNERYTPVPLMPISESDPKEFTVMKKSGNDIITKMNSYCALAHEAAFKNGVKSGMKLALMRPKSQSLLVAAQARKGGAKPVVGPQQIDLSESLQSNYML